MTHEHHTRSGFQSYFWLYAPAGEITPKKIKRTGDLSAVFAAETKGDNPLTVKLCDVDHMHAIHTRHLTVFEQPRTPEKPGEFRYQPVQTIDDLLHIVESAQGVASGHMPIKLGGRSLEIIEKTNKLHMAMTFNSEAERVFDEFYQDMMNELAGGRVHDSYKGHRRPRLFLGKGYKSEFKRVDIKSARKSFNDKFLKFPTKPVSFDRLVLGQGFFDVHGKNLARRDIATIYFDGGPLDWHCDNPMNQAVNQQLIQATADARAQAQANAPRRPLLVS